MGIVRARLIAATHFPLGAHEIELPTLECQSVVARFRTDSQAGNWTAFKVADTSDWTPEEVRKWLASLEIRGEVKVVWIGLQEGIKLDYRVFVSFYDDLWFPASDDVLLVTSSGDCALEMSHEEIFHCSHKLHRPSPEGGKRGKQGKQGHPPVKPLGPPDG